MCKCIQSWYDFANLPKPDTVGASTALLGREAAMACTVAVETAIGEHYDSQLRHLMNEDDDDGIGGLRDNRALVDTIRQFRDEELEHLDTGLRHDAEQVGWARRSAWLCVESHGDGLKYSSWRKLSLSRGQREIE